jgi:hypothetical protein
MAGWLTLMVVIAVAGREATRDAVGVPGDAAALGAGPGDAVAADPAAGGMARP